MSLQYMTIEEAKIHLQEETDPTEAQIWETMLVLIAARDIGIDLTDLELATGLPRATLELVGVRMRAAGLWRQGRYDTRDWTDPLLNEWGFHEHCEIAEGNAVRAIKPTHVISLVHICDAKSGEVRETTHRIDPYSKIA